MKYSSIIYALRYYAVFLREEAMYKSTIFAIAFLSLVSVSFVTDSSANAQNKKTILSFKTMYGVDGPFVGESNPIRGVNGDELPWEIEKSISGKLETNGHLKISVRGLVFKDDPSVPPELIGKNDETEFRGLVSCLTEVGNNVVTQNVVTAGFPANEDGNSVINTNIQLPNPCVAPIIMVLAGSENKWFAVTGFETEEE
jgi:hypothetical protein